MKKPLLQGKRFRPGSGVIQIDTFACAIGPCQPSEIKVSYYKVVTIRVKSKEKQEGTVTDVQKNQF
ncbi:hypothetical protein [Paenibacillus durus]|uniref:Uncharacterized protein n=1 Tax=Paenibacillus durus TaxID=44251 RepID=A0A089HM23_PAEDU|nr:hypothetical protein [Paenibacillus durus]AIQ11770.1 hypothetical protein PDUR_07345 [Paenibacillus durus]